MLEVSEIFYSIQGESTFAGLPCIFVRLSGCNLRCHYCDARYTYEEPGTSVEIDSLIPQLEHFPCTLVEITGGEPLLQKNVYPLIDRLIERNYTVLIETNGSLALHEVPCQAHVIMDIKCPDSGESSSFLIKNLDILSQRSDKRCRRDEVKFVISSPADYHWAREMRASHSISDYCEVLFSPVVTNISPGMLAELILQDSLPVRLQLQLHTALWPGNTRGK